MEGGATSVFSGMGYEPSQNTVTHYKAGKPIKNKKDKNIYRAPKARKPKAKVKSVFTGKCDVDDKYCSGSKYTNPLGA